MIKDKTIYIRNIFYMLSYALQDLCPENEEDIAGEEFEHIHDLLASMLSKGVARQIKQGLHCEYQDYLDNLSSLRGKVNMPGTMKNQLAHRRVVTCEYDEFSPDNLLNQILKTAAVILLHHGNVSAERRTDLKRCLLFFTNISQVNPAAIRWSAIRFTRNTRSYRMLMAMCQLLFQGMLPTDKDGEISLMTYIKPDYMAKLFEKFILGYYVQECHLAKVSAPQIKWAVDDGYTTMLPTMQSDIMLTQGGCVLIIDAKYYTHSTQENWGVHTINSANLYQIFTYVKNKESELERTGVPHQVSGLLLYAKTDEDIQPDGIYQMSGNQISVKTLDLNLPFIKIRAQLDTIAASHFGKNTRAL